MSNVYTDFFDNNIEVVINSPSQLMLFMCRCSIKLVIVNASQAFKNIGLKHST